MSTPPPAPPPPRPSPAGAPPSSPPVAQAIIKYDHDTRMVCMVKLPYRLPNDRGPYAQNGIQIHEAPNPAYLLRALLLLLGLIALAVMILPLKRPPLLSPSPLPFESGPPLLSPHPLPGRTTRAQGEAEAGGRALQGGQDRTILLVLPLDLWRTMIENNKMSYLQQLRSVDNNAIRSRGS
jgi:hypothetical protein